MDEERTEKNERTEADPRALIRETIEEFLRKDHARTEPAYKAELLEERKRREQLERRVNELIEENRRSRKLAEETDRNSTIRSELQRLGVHKVDLAFRACREDVVRTEDGRLVARSEQGEVPLRDYLTRFVNDNPEFLPARIAGGSGASSAHKAPAVAAGVTDLDKIKPGMSAEDADRIRQEIAKIASQTLRGL
jgi:hypothetical protein